MNQSTLKPPFWHSLKAPLLHFKARNPVQLSVSMTQAALFGLALGVGVAALKVFALMGYSCFG